MSRKNFSASAIALAFLVVIAGSSHADAAENRATTITVGEMCGGCVKRITAKLEPMAGIADVRCDVRTKTVQVIPADRYRLSPRGLWTAMEEIGKTPKKLTGPNGTFTSKPAS